MVPLRTLGSVEGAADNQFSQPRGITISHESQEVFVVDSNNHRVQVFDLRSLAFIRSIGEKHIQVLARPGSTTLQHTLNERALGNPMSCALDDDGCLYVSDTSNHRIMVYDHNSGDLMRIISRQGSLAGFVNKPHGIAIDIPERHLYVCDYHNHRVQVFDKDTGTFIRSIGQYGTVPGSAPGQFHEPISVALDTENDTVLVCDFLNDRIQVFNKSNGHYIKSIGGGLSGEFRGPRGLYIDSGSKLLFVADKENNQVKIYDKNSFTFLRAFSSGSASVIFNRPMELCVNVEEGTLLVVDAYNHRVQVVPVEELQDEKYRLQERLKALQVAEERQRNKPKASRTTVETDLRHSIVHMNHDNKNILTLRFPHLGPLYTVVVDLGKLCQNDPIIEKAIFPQLLEQLSKLDDDNNNKDNNTLSKLKTDDDVMKDIMLSQAEAFMGAMSAVHARSPSLVKKSDNSDDSNLRVKKLLVPSALALHSLLERSWKPEPNVIPRGVISSLASVLADLDGASVSHEEQERVIAAIGAIFRGAAQAGDEEFVYKSILDSLQCLDEPCYEEFIVEEDTPQMQLSPVNSSQDLNNGSPTIINAQNSGIGTKSIVSNADQGTLRLGRATAAHLQLICDILDQGRERHGSTREELPQDTNEKEHSSISFASAYHKDVVKLVFGSTLARCSDPQPSLSIGPSIPTPNQLTPGTPGSANRSTPGQSPARQLQRSSPARPSLSGIPRDLWRSPSSNTTTPLQKPTRQVLVPKAPIPAGLQPLLEAVFRVQCARNNGDDSNEEFQKLRIDTLQLAARHFGQMQSQIEGSEDQVSKTPNTRGGSNIWRKGEEMCVGDLVDAMDKEKCWFESIITEVRPGMNVKVHFMGWGSKWDDIISMEELETRIAPLNSMTRDWRGDLFEGGLIEIKCNDDTVHQKWMWGKIIAMSVEEEWVDVSYNFSNEPVIIKRAMLYGETICPVGMHTKDRSKAVLATIVRPPQKAEELVSQKKESVDDAAFYDREDELLWDIDGALGMLRDRNHSSVDTANTATTSAQRSTPGGEFLSPQRRSSVKKGKEVDTEILYSTLLTDDSSPIDHISSQVFQALMAEVLSAITEGLSPSSQTENDEDYVSSAGAQKRIKELAAEPCFKAAEQVLLALATGPFKRLLAPYFCRLLTFQCGIQARLQAHAFLAIAPNQIRTAEELLGSAATLHQIQESEGLYAQLAVQCLGDYLSVGLMRRVLQRLTATVKRCALTTIASKFTMQLRNSQKSDLQRVLLQELLQDKARYSGKPCALRGLLSRLLDACDHEDLCSIAEVWTEVMKDWITIRCCNKRSENSATASQTEDISYSLLDDLLTMLASARQACEHEFGDAAGTFRVCADVAFYRAFSQLPPHHLSELCKALAHRLAQLLDTSSSNVPNGRSTHAELLDQTIDLVYVGLAETVAGPFQRCYEDLLAARLLKNSFNMHEELRVLKRLPCMPQVKLMLDDVDTFGSYMVDFKKAILGRLDRGELLYGPEMDILFRKPNSVKIRAISSSVWPAHCTKISVYHALKLPAHLQKLACEFEKFCSTLPTSWPLSEVQAFSDAHSDANSGLCKYRLDYRSFLAGGCELSPRKKKLYWCHGSGTVNLSLIVGGKTRVSIDVSEPHAAILMVFNNTLDKSETSLSVHEVATSINLSPEVTLELLQSLCKGKVPVLEQLSGTKGQHFKVCSQILKEDKYSNKSRVLRTCISSSSSTIDVFARQERKWLDSCVDAAIIRCLKLRATGTPMSAEDLCAAVRDNLCGGSAGQCISVPVQSADILIRCESLIDFDLIRKVNTASTGALSGMGFVYADRQNSTTTPRSSLFTQLVSTLSIVHANPSQARVSMKQFTFSYMDWVGKIAIPTLNTFDRNEGFNYSYCSELGDSDSDDKDRRWSDPLRTMEVKSIASTLLLSTGIAVTQLARLETQSRAQTAKARSALEQSLASFTSTAERLTRVTGSALNQIVDQMDMFRLCFETVRPIYVKSALQLLFACSSEPCPSPEALNNLDSPALLERVSAQWNRKHAVSPAALENAGNNYGCATLVDALLYVGTVDVSIDKGNIESPSIHVSAGAIDTANKGNSDRDREEEKGVSPSGNASYMTSSESRRLHEEAMAAMPSLRISLKDIFFAAMQYDEPASRAAMAIEKVSQASSAAKDIISASSSVSSSVSTNTGPSNSTVTSSRTQPQYSSGISNIGASQFFNRSVFPPVPPSILANGALHNVAGLQPQPPLPPSSAMSSTSSLSLFLPPRDLPSMSFSPIVDTSSIGSNSPLMTRDVSQTPEPALSLNDRLLVYLSSCEQSMSKAFPLVTVKEDEQESKQTGGEHSLSSSMGFSGLAHAAAAVPVLSQLLIDNTASLIATYVSDVECNEKNIENHIQEEEKRAHIDNKSMDSALLPSITGMTEAMFTYLDKDRCGTFGAADMDQAVPVQKEVGLDATVLDDILAETLGDSDSPATSHSVQEVLHTVRQAVPSSLATHELLQLLSQCQWDATASVDMYWACPDIFVRIGLDRYRRRKQESSDASRSLLFSPLNATATTKSANFLENEDLNSRHACISCAATGNSSKTTENSADAVLSLSCGHSHCISCWKHCLNAQELKPLVCPTCSMSASAHFIYWISRDNNKDENIAEECKVRLQGNFRSLVTRFANVINTHTSEKEKSLHMTTVPRLPCVAVEDELFDDMRLHADLTSIVRRGMIIFEICQRSRPSASLQQNGSATPSSLSAQSLGTQNAHGSHPLLWMLLNPFTQKLEKLHRILNAPRSAQPVPLRDNSEVMALALSIRLHSRSALGLCSLLETKEHCNNKSDVYKGNVARVQAAEALVREIRYENDNTENRVALHEAFGSDPLHIYTFHR